MTDIDNVTLNVFFDLFSEMYMSPCLPLKVLASKIENFDREQCIDELLNFPYLPFDFSRDFLEKMTIERLKYVIVAAYHTVKKYHPA